jgi:hypothetical protein
MEVKMKKVIILLVVLALVGCYSFVLAEKANRIATIAQLKGKVDVKISGKAWVPAEKGMVLTQGDLIRTKSDGWALLNLDGNAQTAMVEVKKESQLGLAELLEDKNAGTQKTLLDLALGEVLIKAKKLHSEKSSFEVKTPTSVVGVRGTTFSVTVEAAE